MEKHVGPAANIPRVADGFAEPGILRPHQSLHHFDYQSHDPPVELKASIENFWTITWDLPLVEPYIAQVLPYPSVNLSVTNTEADVTGLVRRRYERHLIGEGYAVGARFRPGCFRPFVDFSVSELTNRHRPIAEVLGRDTTELQHAIGPKADIVARARLLAEFLTVGCPEPDATASRLAELVAEIAQTRQITRVGQVAERAGWSVRRLQRLFSDYVGAGPKWVIQRCRLQDAAAAAAAGPVDWAALAVELGFTDQAHLTRAFTTTIGTPPAAYADQAQPALKDYGVSDAVRTPVR